MDTELWIFAAVMCFVVIVWFNAARSSGVLESVNEDGFVLITFLRSRRRLRWIDIARPARQFDRFLPRLIMQTSTRYKRLTSAYTLYLRGRPGEQDLIDKLRDSVGIKAVQRLGG